MTTFGRRARSGTEIRDRLSQEVRNLYSWMRPPCLPADADAPTPLVGLPDPGAVARALRSSPFSIEISELSKAIRGHCFPILGLTVETGTEIRWRRDYSNMLESRAQYFRRIPYLNKARAGDHKIIWELNRHQHLVTLAQDYRLNANRESLAEITVELESWFEQNPFQRGINWASALEVAFRALSWTWVWHLAGQALAPAMRRRLLEQIYRHGCYLETNLSLYFSPNTHLLGEAVALYALGALFPFKESRRWTNIGKRLVELQLETQVRPDGSHFEQSAYYHVYALDMFLFYAVLTDTSDEYRERLGHMADYLHELLGPAREIPLLGDDDGGRFFHPYGKHTQYGRATLATCAVLLNRTDWPAQSEDLAPQCAWWLGRTTGNEHVEPVLGRGNSRFFGDAGVAVLTADDIHVIVDAGPFGSGGAGHSHSDTLSIVARVGESEILIDPGTYTYVGDSEQRNYFRGSATHNTVRIDGLNQALVAGPFRWTSLPEVTVSEWLPGPSADILEAECRYSGFIHRRRLIFVRSGALLVADRITGPEGDRADHEIEQFWHLGASVDLERFTFAQSAELVKGWRSTAFGQKTEAEVLRVRLRSRLPCSLGAGIALRPGRIDLIEEGLTFHFVWKPIGGPESEWKL